LNPLRFLFRVARRMKDIGLARAAATLSYTTLVALVPMLTVGIAFAATTPMFGRWFGALESFVLRNLLPGSTADVAHRYVLTFAEHATRLTGVSIVIIVVTATFAIATVERELNLIWDVHVRRPLPRRIVVYLLGLTVGPVLLGASISLTTWLIGTSLAAVPIERTLGDRVVGALPFVFAAAGLTLLYKAVPARAVRWSQALAGGLLAALALEAAKFGFAWYVTRVAIYELVYGALAALPVFLLWIYLCWVIVLAGAAVGATLAAPAGGRTVLPRRGGRVA
jgi:membrane protein